MDNNIEKIFDDIQKEIDEKTISCARLDGYVAGLKMAMAKFDILRGPVKSDSTTKKNTKKNNKKCH